MPDHMHVLVQLGEAISLSTLVNRLKGGAARAVNLVLGRRGPVWQPAFHDRQVRTEDDLETLGRYIIANPLRAGLVSRISDYPHWDADWL